MSIIKPQSHIERLSGKVGNLNFADTKMGPVMRSKRRYHRPDTDAVKASNKKLGAAQNSWSNIPDRVKRLWNEFGKQFMHINKLGYSWHFTGQEIIIRVNRNLLEIDEPILISPPENISVFTYDSISLQVIKDGYYVKDIILNTVPERCPDDVKVIIYATDMLKKGTLYVNPNKYRKIGYIDSSFVSGSSILSMYRTVFLSHIMLSFKLAFILKPVNRLTGLNAEPLEYTFDPLEQI